MPDLTEAEFKEIVRTKTDEQLRMKLRIGDMICWMLRNDGDPRAPAAIRRLRRQQRWIMDVQLERKRAERKRLGIPEPGSVTVKLQALRLFGRAPAIRRHKCRTGSR